jgi:hypothetical protein
MRVHPSSPAVRSLAIPVLLAGGIALVSPGSVALARIGPAGTADSAAAFSVHGQLDGVLATSADNATWSRSARFGAADRAAGQSVAVLSCLRHRDLKPADHVLSCGTATASWQAVTWSHWGVKTATGKGQLLRNDCTPRCAKGRFRSYPATIALSGVRTTKKYGALFSKARVSYLVKGKRTTHSFGLLGPVHSTPPRVKLQTSSGGEFLSPLSGMSCEIDLGQGQQNETYCQTFTPEESVTMSAGGTLKKCTRPTPESGCVGNPGENTPTLHYGKATGGGPFRCLSSKTGLICTVKKGNGFVISLSHITRIRGY